VLNLQRSPPVEGGVPRGVGRRASRLWCHSSGCWSTAAGPS